MLSMTGQSVCLARQQTQAHVLAESSAPPPPQSPTLGSSITDIVRESPSTRFCGGPGQGKDGAA